MNKVSTIYVLLIIFGVMSIGCTPSIKGVPTTDAIEPPGVLLNIANIRRFTPDGFSREAMMSVYRKMKADKRGKYLNGWAIAISHSHPHWIFWHINGSSNPLARVAVLEECGRQRDDCELYAVGKVIVYKGPYARH